MYRLVEDGVREITLLGQNVNSYQGMVSEEDSEIKKETSFAELICLLNKTEGLERIRFMTSHPKDLSEELIEAYVSCEKLCLIHLPVQSEPKNSQ